MARSIKRSRRPAIALAGALVTALCVGLAGESARGKGPLELLRETPRPQFRQGHTLLPLSRWGWAMPYDVRVELTEHWGYALEFGAASARSVRKLDDPESVASKLCALAASDPKRYPLCVLTDRPFFSKDFRAGLPDEAWCRDAQGRVIEKPHKRLSPEAPDAIFAKAGALAAEPLAKIRQEAPIAILLNGGEYPLGVIGFSLETWQQDPRVLAAKGDKSWFDYISQRKGHQERIISDAIRRAVPDRVLYLYYHTSGCPHRHRTADWWRWAWDYQYMEPVSDIANISVYYMQFNTGWTGRYDMLTQVFNAVGRDVQLGQPLSYNWLCAGWEQKKLGPEAFSDMPHYMGFLKCYYTSGMVGGVAGYFSFPKGGFGADLGDEMPSWLAQQVVLAHAHALFSRVDDFLRQGDLLPGPDKHRWSKDQPACEFPTGDPDARVLARRHRKRDEWLLTAWAAGGRDRSVTVTIPDLGPVTLLARDCGTVYRAALRGGKPSLEQLDADGMFPTAAPGPRPDWVRKALK